MRIKDTDLLKAADDYGFQVPYDGTKEFYNHIKIDAFIAGAIWQKEKMFSKEDLINFAHFYFKEEYNSSMQDCKTTEEIFDLFQSLKQLKQ